MISRCNIYIIFSCQSVCTVIRVSNQLLLQLHSILCFIWMLMESCCPKSVENVIFFINLVLLCHWRRVLSFGTKCHYRSLMSFQFDFFAVLSIGMLSLIFCLEVKAPLSCIIVEWVWNAVSAHFSLPRISSIWVLVLCSDGIFIWTLFYNCCIGITTIWNCRPGELDKAFFFQSFKIICHGLGPISFLAISVRYTTSSIFSTT